MHFDVDADENDDRDVEPGRIAHDPRHGLLLPADGMRGSNPFSVVMLFNPTSLECEHYGRDSAAN
jgi:hypothetical protein